MGSWENFQLNLTAITIIFIQENYIDNNVCEIVAHVSQPQCANIPLAGGIFGKPPGKFLANWVNPAKPKPGFKSYHKTACKYLQIQ